MITPPLSISARPVLTRKVARSAMGPHSRREPCLPRCGRGNLVPTSPAHRWLPSDSEHLRRLAGGVFRVWGPSPGPRYRLQVRIAPRACSYARTQAAKTLLELEGADPVSVRRLVTGVDPVGERLDQSHQRRVGADVGRAIG